MNCSIKNFFCTFFLLLGILTYLVFHDTAQLSLLSRLYVKKNKSGCLTTRSHRPQSIYIISFLLTALWMCRGTFHWGYGKILPLRKACLINCYVWCLVLTLQGWEEIPNLFDIHFLRAWRRGPVDPCLVGVTWVPHAELSDPGLRSPGLSERNRSWEGEV